MCLDAPASPRKRKVKDMSKAKKLKWRKVLGGYKAGPFAVYATDTKPWGTKDVYLDHYVVIDGYLQYQSYEPMSALKEACEELANKCARAIATPKSRRE